MAIDGPDLDPVPPILVLDGPDLDPVPAILVLDVLDVDPAFDAPTPLGPDMHLGFRPGSDAEAPPADPSSGDAAQAREGRDDQRPRDGHSGERPSLGPPR